MEKGREHYQKMAVNDTETCDRAEDIYIKGITKSQ
jgi:phage terminase large subunit-like protein